MPSGSLNSNKTHCPNGHIYDDANTYTWGGSRKCKACHNGNEKIAYRQDSTKQKARIYNRKAEFRHRVNTLKLACVSCGEPAVECLDFHHQDPDCKVHSVSWLVSNGRPWSTIEAEIAKCIVLCSNCHRKLEAKKRKETKCSM